MFFSPDKYANRYVTWTVMVHGRNIPSADELTFKTEMIEVQKVGMIVGWFMNENQFPHFIITSYPEMMKDLAFKKNEGAETLCCLPISRPKIMPYGWTPAMLLANPSQINLSDG
jgi:hypothetical protein